MKKALLIFLLLSGPASAQIMKDTRTEAIRVGQETGKLAGNAYYCQIDEDDLEVFISLSHARIISSSQDRADRVVAHLEFSNNYSFWATEAPEEGCEAFITTFYTNYGHLF